MMRTIVRQGLPETLLFVLTFFILLNISPFPLVEGVQEDIQGKFLPTVLTYFLLGFMPGFYTMLKRIGSEGFGVNASLLVIPGLILLYFSLLPYLVSFYGFNLPGSNLGVDLLFASKVATLWFGSLVCRSLGRIPDERQGVTYLRPPYQV